MPTTQTIPTHYTVAGRTFECSARVASAACFSMEMLEREIVRTSTFHPELPLGARMQLEADHRFLKAHREARRLGAMPRND